MTATATATRVISWFEIPAVDFDRAVRFYEAALNTSLTREAFGGVPMAVFAHEEENTGGCIVHQPGQLRPAGNGEGVLVYLNAEPSVSATLERIVDAGGKQDGSVIELPNNFGYVGYFFDTEGNRIGLHSPSLR